MLVQRLAFARVVQYAAEIFAAHCGRAADEIAQIVGEVGIHALVDEFPGDIAVVVVGHIIEYEIAHRVHAEQPLRVRRRNDCCPRDLLIFNPSIKSHGCPKTCLGRGRSSAIRKRASRWCESG